jgi:flagellar L-ring protein precursor FlgH
MKNVRNSACNLRLALASACMLAAASLASAQSLWPADGRSSERSMFADRKASASGDILTVVVQESANATTTQNKSLERQSSLNDAIQQFLYSAAVSKFGTSGGELPSSSASGKSTYSGGGAVANSQSLSSRAAVLVTDRLPNGNLVIQGVRMVTFSGETQYVILHGIVRPDDISAANTVFSTNVAEARVEFLSEGQLTDAQKRGWLAKIYEKLRPL